MNKSNNIQNYVLNQIKSNNNEYIKYIVTDKQKTLIDSIDDTIVDINGDIEKTNENFTLISLDEIVNGSFEGKDIYQIFKENGCNNPKDFSIFESFEYYYEELKKINNLIVSKYDDLEFFHNVLEESIRSRDYNYIGTDFNEIIETGDSDWIESLYLSNGAKNVAYENSFWDVVNTLDEIKNVD